MSKLIDLDPNEWKSERPKERQPFFGPGLWPAIVWIASFTFVSLMVRKFVGY